MKVRCPEMNQDSRFFLQAMNSRDNLNLVTSLL